MATQFNPDPSGPVNRDESNMTFGAGDGSGGGGAGGGGGDSLWTESGTQTYPTNHATTLVIDTANKTLTAANANAINTDPIIVEGKRGSDVTYRVWGDGSVYHGSQTMAKFGPPRTEFGMLSPLVAYLDSDTNTYSETAIQSYYVLHNTAVDTLYDVALQASGSSYHRLQTTGVNGYVGQVNFDISFNDSATIEVKSGGGGSGGSYRVFMSGFENNPWFQMEGGSSITYVRFEPSGTFGTPFFLKTNASIGSGDVFTVTNNATLGFGVNFQGKVRTAQPSANGAGEWRLGKKLTATVSALTTGYIEVEIDGVVYKLGLVT